MMRPRSEAGVPSTCATYGIPGNDAITEETPQRPVNPYGESKLAFEKALRWYDEAYGTEKPDGYFNAAGASERFGEDHHHETHIIPPASEALMGKSTHISILARIIQHRMVPDPRLHPRD